MDFALVQTPGAVARGLVSISFDASSVSSDDALQFFRDMDRISLHSKSIRIIGLPDLPSRSSQNMGPGGIPRPFDESLEWPLCLLAKRTNLTTFVSDECLRFATLHSLSTAQSLKHLQVKVAGCPQKNDDPLAVPPLPRFPALRTL